MIALPNLLSERIALLPQAMPAIQPGGLLERDPPHRLALPGTTSANGHCRLLPARDGWVALNLARPDDAALLPALTGRETAGWEDVAASAEVSATSQFVAGAVELGLPVAAVGEAKPLRLARERGRVPDRIVDLSSLWAGPLCAGLLARAGADVARIQSPRRPDPTPFTSPRLDAFLNGGKRRLTLDVGDRVDRARLKAEILEAEVLVTSARAAALRGLGLEPTELFESRPDLIWVAITAHGWDADRVGFGDDCAAAGGLLRWDAGEPRFRGDALADPLTGLEAALAVCERRAEERGGFLDLAMARVAAAYGELVSA